MLLKVGFESVLDVYDISRLYTTCTWMSREIVLMNLIKLITPNLCYVWAICQFRNLPANLVFGEEDGRILMSMFLCVAILYSMMTWFCRFFSVCKYVGTVWIDSWEMVVLKLRQEQKSWFSWVSLHRPRKRFQLPFFTTQLMKYDMNWLNGLPGFVVADSWCRLME